MKSLADMRLYCFSPGPFLKGRDPEELVRAQIRGGADVVQLREKKLGKRDKLAMGRVVKRVTREMGALFIVNDDLDLALILDADGLHLGQEDIPIREARPFFPGIIGVSTHSLEQARQAVDDGADYIGVGPVFATGSKENPDPVVGPELVRKVAAFSPIPLVAIGGITLENAGLVAAAGGRCAAVISDILAAEDIEERARQIRAVLTAQDSPRPA